MINSTQVTRPGTSKKTKRILLTGARASAALELMRHLSRGGHTIFAADTTTMHVSRFSNSLKQFFSIPSPRFNLPEFVDQLVHIVQKESIDLVIPMWEEVIYLSRYTNRFPSTCKVFCADFSTIHSLHHKWEFIKLLSSLGIETPRSVLLRSNNDLETYLFTVPYVLKRCYSRGSRHIIKVTKPGVPKISIESENPWMAQEFIPGNKYCSYSVCYQGKVLAHTCYPVDYTMDGSSCLAFEAIDHPKIFTWVSSFIQKIGYTGQAAFDFIETEEGLLYCIDCNPRATNGLHLFKPEDQIDQAFLHETTETILPKVGNSQQIAMGMMMYGLCMGASEHRLSHYVKKLLTTKDVVFSSTDPLPFLMEPFVLTSYWIQSRRQGLTIPVLFTHDLDWDEDVG